MARAWNALDAYGRERSRTIKSGVCLKRQPESCKFFRLSFDEETSICIQEHKHKFRNYRGKKAVAPLIK